jgi:hypothetical protein
VALVLLGAAALARRILDQRRLAAWDAAWQAIGCLGGCRPVQRRIDGIGQDRR